MNEVISQAKPPLTTEMVQVSTLRSHPRNYRTHPDDQLQHIVASIKQHGFYRNVVITKDGTILAGHGVVEAAKKMNLETVPAVRVDLEPDDPRALKILTGDNLVSHLATDDDRLLTEMLKDIKNMDTLLGTGYDEQMLAALAMVTRPTSEIADVNEAAEWAGMPGYEPAEIPLQLAISFRNKEDRDEFIAKFQIALSKKSDGARSWTAWWPAREREDLSSLQFKG